MTNGGNKLRHLTCEFKRKKLIHSLQVMYEDWEVSFYREKQCLLTVELKNLTTKQRKTSLRLWCSFPAKYFSSGWQTVCKNYWTWYKLPWPNYRETKLKSTNKRNFLALKEIFLTSPGCCLALASSQDVAQVRLASWNVNRVLLGNDPPNL